MPKAELRTPTPQELRDYLTRHGWVRDESLSDRDHTAYALREYRIVYYIPASAYQFQKILRRLCAIEKRKADIIHREIINYVS